MNFNQIYKETINNLLLEGNLKQLSNLFQDNYFREFPNIKSDYNKLSNDQKQILNNYINDQKLIYLDYINSITDNPQFQSSICDWLINRSVIFPEDIDKVKEIINDYIQLTKKSDNNFKSINQFNTYSDLFNYVQSYKKQSKIKSNLPFELINQNNIYNVYIVNQDQYDDLNEFYGGKQYFNTGWCVAKNKSYFDQYLNDYNIYNEQIYYLFTLKDDSPYALLHIDSNQLKDKSDNSLKNNQHSFIDLLYKILSKYTTIFDVNKPVSESNDIFLSNMFLEDLKFYQPFIYKKYLKDNNIKLSNQLLFILTYDDKETANMILDPKTNKINGDYILLNNMHSSFVTDGKLNISFGKVDYFEVEQLDITDTTNFPDRCNILNIIDCYHLTTVNDINVIYNVNIYKCDNLQDVNINRNNDFILHELKIEVCDNLKNYYKLPKCKNLTLPHSDYIVDIFDKLRENRKTKLIDYNDFSILDF